MESPYFTPPRTPASSSGRVTRVTRSQTRRQNLAVEPSPLASREVAMQPVTQSSSAEPSTPTKRQRAPKPSKKVESVVLPPTPESLPRSKRKRLFARDPVVPVDESAQAAPGPSVVIARDETGHIEPVGKIRLAQERLMHDPWRLLVMTTLLNKTSGRAVRPIFEILMERYPTAVSLSQASVPDLADLLYPLGLFNQRASSLIRFSQQYLAYGWPTASVPRTRPCANGCVPLNTPLPDQLDVTVFYGSGIYASDSFRIFSPLLPGRGGPAEEGAWVAKRARALQRMKAEGIDDAEEKGVEVVRAWMSDEDHALHTEDEWRTVIPTDKELRRYLIWRWGLEGIVYDINRGPRIVQERDRVRLGYLLRE